MPAWSRLKPAGPTGRRRERTRSLRSPRPRIDASGQPRPNRSGLLALVHKRLPSKARAGELKECLATAVGTDGRLRRHAALGCTIKSYTLGRALNARSSFAHSTASWRWTFDPSTPPPNRSTDLRAHFEIHPNSCAAGIARRYPPRAEPFPITARPTFGLATAGFTAGRRTSEGSGGNHGRSPTAAHEHLPVRISVVQPTARNWRRRSPSLPRRCCPVIGPQQVLSRPNHSLPPWTERSGDPGSRVPGNCFRVDPGPRLSLRSAGVTIRFVAQGFGICPTSHSYRGTAAPLFRLTRRDEALGFP